MVWLRRLWGAFLILVLVSGLPGLGGPIEMLGYFLGVIICYLIPVKVYDRIFGKTPNNASGPSPNADEKAPAENKRRQGQDAD